MKPTIKVRILELLRLIEEALEQNEYYGLEWAFAEIRGLLK